MAYPLIIFGAGASYDFLKASRYSAIDRVILKQWHPPLTNNIFDVSRFLKIVEKYEDVKPLASTVTNIVENKENIFDLEGFLSEQEQQFPEKSYSQIIALRFYLAELFSKISFHFYRDVNNHRHLIDQINKRVGKAIVVNFNYDTLFENNLSGINIENNYSIDKYISGDIKVIKIHGAHNWRYSPEINIEKQNPYNFFVSGGQSLYEQYKDHEVYPTIIKNLDYNRQDFLLNSYVEHEESPFPGGRFLYYLPAIAIPIASKSEYVCPKSHIEVLKAALPLVDRVIVIGWRAQDDYLLSLLKDHLKDFTRLTIVSTNKQSGEEISLKFKDIEQIHPECITISESGGYTNFMVNNEFEKFLT